MNLITLNSVFTLYERNFRMLHWLAKGKKFDRIHKLSEDYAEMVHGDIDVTAEMALRLNLCPSNLAEVLKDVEDNDIKHIYIECGSNIDYEEFVKYSEIMLGNILKIVGAVRNSEEMQEDINMGIKAELEAMFNKYDLQARYLNARRQ